jgi:hypothetical protein
MNMDTTLEMEKEIIRLKMKCNLYFEMIKMCISNMEDCSDDKHKHTLLAMRGAIDNRNEYSVDYNDIKRLNMLSEYPNLSKEQ